MSHLKYFEEIFKTSPSPNLLLSADSPRYTIIDVNEAYCKATSTSRMEMLGKGVFEVFPGNPKDQESKNVSNLRTTLEKVIARKELQKMEAQQYDIPVRGTNDFELRYWTSQNAPVLNEKGDVLLIIHSPTDITGQILAEQKEKKANEELLKNQEHYRSLFDNNPDAVFSFSLDGTFLSANKQLASLAECSLKELMEITFVPFVAPEDTAKVFDHFEKAGAGEIQNYNTGMITAKGNRLIVNVTNIPIIVNYQIVGVYGIAKDITKNFRADQDLKQSREKLQKIMDSSVDVICTINEEKIFVKVSIASFNIWGYLPEEIEGRPYTDLIYGEEIENLDKSASNSKIANIRSGFENQYKRKDGKIIDMSWSAYWDDTEKLAYCVGRNITAHKAATETIKHNEKRFRTLLQNSTDGLALISRRGALLEISETGKKILCYSEDDIVGEVRPDLIHPEDLDALRKTFANVLQNPKTIEYLEFRFLLRLDAIAYCQGSPVPDKRLS